MNTSDLTPRVESERWCVFFDSLKVNPFRATFQKPAFKILSNPPRLYSVDPALARAAHPRYRGQCEVGFKMLALVSKCPVGFKLDPNARGCAFQEPDVPFKRRVQNVFKRG